jgi:hypothetical protein
MVINAIEHRWDMFEISPNIVQHQFELAQGYASNAFGIAQGLLRDLANIAGSLSQIDTNVVLEGITLDVPAFTSVKPVRPDFTMNVFSPPDKAPFNNIDLSDLTVPSVDEIIVRTDQIDPQAGGYSSALLTALKAKILRDITNGGSGLGEDIERQLWQRDEERDLLDHQRAMDRIRAEWSASGLPLPDGALISSLTQEEVDYVNRRLDKNRMIAIEMAKIADANTRFAVEQASRLEKILMDFQGTLQQRIFEASKATADLQIQTINAEIAKQRIMVDIYKTIADVRIEDAKAVVQIYTAEVQAYAAEIQAESTRIDSIVRTFLAQVEMYKADVSVYSALTDVEIKILDAQLRIAIERANLTLKNAELQIRQYEALNGLKIEAIKAEGSVAAQLVAGALSGLSAQASMSASDSAGYSFNPDALPIAELNAQSALQIESMKEQAAAAAAAAAAESGG